jgi:regulator of RNase E activity RraA
MEPLSDDQLAALRAVDSPTVANVIELFDVRPQTAGYVDYTVHAVYPSLPPAVGYAVTAQFRGDPPAGEDADYGGMPEMLADALTIPAPRFAVFEDLSAPPVAATYGEMMVRSFKHFGFAGLFTSGAGRDIEQVRALAFPCWATSMIVAHGYPRVIAGNVPVSVCGLAVAPGDLLHGDGNGIVSIPRAIASGVAELCGEFIAVEDGHVADLQEMAADPAAYAESVARVRAGLATLKERALAMGLS